MHVIICGGRDRYFTPHQKAWLDAYHAAHAGITKVYTGGASGIDTDAKEWAEQHGITCEVCNADWKKYGLVAGPIRNKAMLRKLYRQRQTYGIAVLAFPGGTGTADMIRQAKDAGVLVITYEEPVMPEMMAPPSSPLMGMTQPDTSPVPMLDDDIADPPVPETVIEGMANDKEPLSPSPPTQAWAEHEALLKGFCEAIQAKLTGFMTEEHKGLMKTFDDTMHAMRKWIETVGQDSEHAKYQMSDVLSKLQSDGMQLRQDIYQLTVNAYSPKGFPLTFTIMKTTQEALNRDMITLFASIAEAGLTPTPM